MPRFFYSASNLQSYHTPDSWWQRWRKKREKKHALKRLDANLVQVQNPFKKDTGGTKSFSKARLIGVATIFLVWIGMMLFLPYFQITKVEFRGLNIIKLNEIDNFVHTNFLYSSKRWWPRNNYFILNKNKIVESIKNNFSVDSVVVEKIFSNSLKVTVQEKTSSVVYDNGHNYILLDDKGNFIRVLRKVAENGYTTTSVPTNPSSTTAAATAAAQTVSTTVSSTIRIHKPIFAEIKKEIGNFPLIYDERVGRKDKNTLEEEVIQAVLTWQKLLQQTEVGELQYFELNNLAAGLKIKTSKSFDILVNIHGNHENALSNLETVLKENHPVEYIDLRYGEKVYLK